MKNFSENVSPDAIAESLLDWWRAAGIEPESPPSARAAPPGGESFQQAKQAAAPAPGTASRRAQRPALDDSWDDAPAPAAKTAGPIARPRSDPALAGSMLEAAADAQKIAARCNTLGELREAIAAFDGVTLKGTAKQSVFDDGVAGAAIMVVGEAPGREEDEKGRPFVGPAGQLLDKMLAAINLSRQKNVYISNVIYWRPPGNRQPTQTEILTSLPFVERHIALARPKILILAGGVAAKALLRTEEGIMRLRGRKAKYAASDGALELPAFPIFHPSYLLRRPQEKRLAWADLLAIQKAVAAL